MAKTRAAQCHDLLCRYCCNPVQLSRQRYPEWIRRGEEPLCAACQKVSKQLEPVETFLRAFDNDLEAYGEENPHDGDKAR